MDEPAVNAIAALAQPQILKTEDGKEFSTKALHIPPADPYPGPIILSTLSGLLGYLDFEKSASPVLIHVASPYQVDVVSPLGTDRHHQRIDYARVEIEQRSFAFGIYHPVESMIIALQSGFTSTPDRDTVLQLLSAVRQEAVKAADDDGVSQTVSTKAGIVMAATAKVPNPVTLAPYRTFLEIEQPTSTYILRGSGGGPDKLPQFALFLADGGGWELVAMKAIAAWLKANLPESLKDVPVVA